jgi:hypothetical protein
VVKVERNEKNRKEEKITEKQLAYIRSLLEGVEEAYIKPFLALAGAERLEDLSKQAASSFIDAVKMMQRARAQLSYSQELEEALKESLEMVQRVLPAEVSADTKAEIASRFAITAFLERRRGR